MEGRYLRSGVRVLARSLDEYWYHQWLLGHEPGALVDHSEDLARED